MIESLGAILATGAVDLEQLADALWLAQHLPQEQLWRPLASPPAGPGREPASQEPSKDGAHDGSEARHESDGSNAANEERKNVIPATHASDSDLEWRIRSPGVPPLTRRIELGRALRPIGWEVSSVDRWRIIDDATANYIADTRLWVPVLEPEREPALDLVLVIDCDPRLRPWHEFIQALAAVLRSSGRLRNITTWMIAGHEIVPRLRSRGGGGAGHARRVIDPTGRSVVLVISDFAGALWREGMGLACLRMWARRMSTTLVSLLPERLWGRTVLGGLSAVTVCARQPGQPSAALGCEKVKDREAISLPVITIDPISVHAWAALVAGDSRARLTGVAALPDASLDTRARAAARAVLRARGHDDTDGEELERQAARIQQRLCAASRASDAEDPVDRFHRSASPSVVRLAAALVRVPLRLDVMRLVQRTVAPATGPLELAEILGAGLFTPRPDSGVAESAVWFDIAPEMRARIADLAPARDGLRVLELVGRYVREHLGSGYDFEALVVDPSAEPGRVPEQLRPFAQIYVSELERLGGRYRALAQRLARAASITSDDENTASRASRPAAASDERLPVGEGVAARPRRVRESDLAARDSKVAHAVVADDRIARGSNVDFGVVIGIEDYPYFRTVPGAANNARAFCDWLCEKDGGGLSRRNVRLLLSDREKETPDQHEIDQEFVSVLNAAHALGGARRLYFYFSGNAGISPFERANDIALMLTRWSPSLIRLALSTRHYSSALCQVGLFDEVAIFVDGCRDWSVNVVGLEPLFTYWRKSDARSTRMFLAYATEASHPAFDGPESAHLRGMFTAQLLTILRGSPSGLRAHEVKFLLEEFRDDVRTRWGMQRFHVENGFHEESYFGHRPKPQRLALRFAERRGPVVLRDSHLRVVAEHNATRWRKWQLKLPFGLYRIEGGGQPAVAFDHDGREEPHDV